MFRERTLNPRGARFHGFYLLVPGSGPPEPLLEDLVTETTDPIPFPDHLLDLVGDADLAMSFGDEGLAVIREGEPDDMINDPGAWPEAPEPELEESKA